MSLLLQLGLFGGLEVRAGDAPVTGFISSKAPALLVYLAVTRRPHQRDALAALLWGEMGDTEAKKNLRQALSNLRKCTPDHVIITRERAAFNVDAPHWVDVLHFERHVRASREDPAARVEHLAQAAALFQGDFLAGFHLRDAPGFEEWVLGQRLRYRELALHALHTLADHHLQHRHYGRAIEYATRILALDAWREEAHRLLMHALARSGQRAAALNQYEVCRRILAEEIGVPPSLETRTLYERIRAAGERDRPPLPAPTNVFVGRESELERIQSWLADPHHRLLTVLGPGGVGKSRLALQAAHAFGGDFLEGVYLVELSPAPPNARLDHLLAQALAASLQDATALDNQLAAFLADKEMLLVLDNMEHLLTPENRQLLALLLEQAPAVRILVTSRERLKLKVESTLPLDGLPCPEPPATPHDDRRLLLEALRSAPAAQLFTLRARQVQPTFHLEGYEEAFARLCKLVGGLPLALELAASWTQALDPKTIVSELERNLDLLRVAWPDLPPRHRSMQAVWAHSWRLLSSQERACYVRLAVFRGGFTAQAAQTVAGASLPLLASLVDKSLLGREGTRYVFHPLLHHFATAKLEEDPDLQDAVRRTHARYYARLTASQEPVILGGRVEDGLACLRPELENLRLAWQTAVTNQDVDFINQVADVCMQLFDLSGLYSEMRDMAEEAIRALEGHVHPTRRDDALALGRVYGLSCAFHFRLGQHQRARERGQRSLTLLAPFQPHVAYAHSLIYMGAAAYGLGDFPQVVERWRQGMEAYRAAGSIWGACTAQSNLAEVMLALDDVAAARRYAMAAHELAQEMDNGELMAASLQILAVVAMREGSFRQAEKWAEQSVALHRQIEHKAHAANSLSVLAQVVAAQNDFPRALTHLREAVAILRQLGNLLYLDLRLLELAGMALKANAPEEAEAALLEVLSRRRPDAEEPTKLQAAVQLAALRCQQKRWREAAHLAAYAARHPAAAGDLRSEAEAHLHAAAAHLDAAALQDAGEVGASGLWLPG